MRRSTKCIIGGGVVVTLLALCGGALGAIARGIGSQVPAEDTP